MSNLTKEHWVSKLILKATFTRSHNLLTVLMNVSQSFKTIKDIILQFNFISVTLLLFEEKTFTILLFAMCRYFL